MNKKTPTSFSSVTEWYHKIREASQLARAVPSYSISVENGEKVKTQIKIKIKHRFLLFLGSGS
jgi:heat shock protein HspQ